MNCDLLIVIPAFNEEEVVAGCLNSIITALADCLVNYKIVVVDNGSVDKTAELARDMGASVLSIPRSCVSEARNRGASYVASQFIAFIDADVVITEKWGDEFKKILNSYRGERLLTGCQYIIANDGSWIERSWFNNIKDKHINGGNLVISRNAFDDLHGFSVNLKTGEDYDICIRALSLGMEYRFNQGLKAIHLGYPKTLKMFIKREVWHGEGDFQSIDKFRKSPVAIISLIYFISLLFIFIFLFFGNLIASVATLTFILIFNFLLTFYRFGILSLKAFMVNFLLGYFYFCSRFFSMFTALAHRKKIY